MALYEHYEQVLLDSRRQPISLSPNRKALELELLQRLGARGSNIQQHIDWHNNNGVFTGKAPVK